MKNVMDWLKGHWAILVLSLVAIAALPVSLYFSLQMSAKLKEEVQKRADETHRAITENKVTYRIVTPSGQSALEKSTIVNKVYTEAYAKEYEAEAAKAKALAERGEAFNKSDHEVLVANLFPAPQGGQDRTLLAEFSDTYARRYHQSLLDMLGAGKPPTAVEVFGVLDQYVKNEQARIKAERGTEEFSPEESARLQRELFSLRLRQLQRRAEELTTYADATVFAGVKPEEPVQFPQDLPQAMAMAWDMQERAWVHSDVVKAVALANGVEMSPGKRGTCPGGIPGAVVKRIVRVSPDRVNYESGQASAFDPGADKPVQNFQTTITGRVSGPGSQNKWYDVRPVEIEIIASSQRLPMFIDALAQTNFISVLDLDLQAVDVFEDLKSGFYYGDEHVVRATIKVESILLRSWRTPSMPDSVKKALGLMDTGEGAEAPAAPPPPRRQPNAGGNAGGGGGPRRRGDEIPGGDQ
mgnify:CR=1 FL=1